MTIASVARFNARSGTTAGTSWTPPTNNAISAGELLVCWIAIDNTNTTDGDHGEVSSVTIGAGESQQSFAKICEFTNGEGAAGAGITLSCWILQNANAFASGSAMAVGVTGAGLVAFINGWRFTVTGPVHVAGFATGAADNANAPALSIGDLEEDDYLFLYMAAGEGADTTWTDPADFSPMWSHGTIGSVGSGDAGVHSGGSHRIVSGVTGISGVQATTGNHDYVAALVAIREGAAPSSGLPPQRMLMGVGQ